MNRLILIVMLFAFSAGVLPDSAHATIIDITCSHQKADADILNQDCVSDQTQDQTDLEQCQDCCCIHAHILAGMLADTSVTNFPKERMALPPHIFVRSNDLSPLYRPPIV